MQSDQVIYCRKPKEKKAPHPVRIAGRAVIDYKDPERPTTEIQYVAIERTDTTITFIMADGSRWPVEKAEAASIFIPA